MPFKRWHSSLEEGKFCNGKVLECVQSAVPLKWLSYEWVLASGWGQNRCGKELTSLPQYSMLVSVTTCPSCWIGYRTNFDVCYILFSSELLLFMARQSRCQHLRVYIFTWNFCLKLMNEMLSHNSESLARSFSHFSLSPFPLSLSIASSYIRRLSLSPSTFLTFLIFAFWDF